MSRIVELTGSDACNEDKAAYDNSGHQKLPVESVLKLIAPAHQQKEESQETDDYGHCNQSK